MNASTQCVYDQLGDTNEDGTYALVSNTQDLLAITDYYHVNIFRVAPLSDVIFHSVYISDVEEAAFRLSEQS